LQVIVNLISIKIAILILLSFPFSSEGFDNLSDLLAQVEKLNISRGGYTLGKKLENGQRTTARQNAVEAASPWIFKFKDGDLFVVADKATGRVIILYERYETTTMKKVRDLVGSLFLDFGDPTVMAHDKIIYWVFGPEGKLSKAQYEKAKQTDGKLNILATVKLNSDVGIVEDSTQPGEKNVYYIISSEPALKLIGAKEK